MNQKIINVKLTVIGDADVLVFALDDENQDKYIVNLNSSASQGSLKEIFSELLNILLTEDIKLELEIEKDYNKGLYKDVCTEYISDLNQEILRVKEMMKQDLA